MPIGSHSTGPEKVFEKATRRFMVIRRLVDQGHVSWSALPASVQSGMDEVIAEGLADAQYALGATNHYGHVMAQNHVCHNVDAERWYRKAACARPL